MGHEANTILLFAKPTPSVQSLLDRVEQLNYKFVECSSKDDLETLEALDDLSGDEDVAIAILPIHNKLDLSPYLEITKEAKKRFKKLHVIGLYSSKLKFPREEIHQAGVMSLFHSSCEEGLFFNKVFEHAPVELPTVDLSIDSLVRVNVVDISHCKIVPFDLFVYLPANRKTIHYLQADHPLEPQVIAKFEKNRHWSLYIKRSDLKKYQQFCRDFLIGESKAEVSVQEKAAKMSENMKSLMSGFFDDDGVTEEEGQQLLSTLKNVIEVLPDATGDKSEIAEKVGELSSQQMTHYSHSQNVAAYCGLFGLALGINEPQTLRMGGLLHDIGLCDLAPSLIGREIQHMNEEEEAQYKLHPGNGKYTVEQAKMEVPEEVLDMILYHHENGDGSGYPYGKESSEIPTFAKVCAFADEFDKLTSVRTGYRQLSPQQAMMRIAGLDGEAPSPIFDEEFHSKILELFLKDEDLKGVQVKEGDEGYGSIQLSDKKAGEASGPGTFGDLLTKESLVISTKDQDDGGESVPAEFQEEYIELCQQLSQHFKLVKSRLKEASE